MKAVKDSVRMNNKPAEAIDPARPTQDVVDKIVLLLVSGLARSAIEEAIEKLGLSGESVPLALAEARMRITIAARWDRNEQLGTAMVRLNDIYRRALAAQDTKSALAAQKELNRLLDLYSPPPRAPSDNKSDSQPDIDQTDEVAAARAHLAPLELGDDSTPLGELCRLAVLRFLDHGNKRLQTTPRAKRRATRTASPARLRNRAAAAD